jgi:hypothetical protein
MAGTHISDLIHAEWVPFGLDIREHSLKRPVCSAYTIDNAKVLAISKKLEEIINLEI